MLRAAFVSALLAVALAGCKAPPQKAQTAEKTEQAAASTSPPAAAPPPSAPAAPAQPPHNYAFKSGQEYGYVSASHAEAAQGGEPEQPTIVRYLGMEDGVYTIAEVENGAVVVASCAPPCQEVRIRGKDLDQTLPLNPGSIVYAALTDAINGQLDVYKMRRR